MVKSVRAPLLIAGIASLVMIAANSVGAEDNSSLATPSGQSGQSLATPSADLGGTNPTSQPTSPVGTATEQQAKAPVVDPHAATQNATDKTDNTATIGPTNNAQHTNPQEWPAPQRYDSGRAATGSSRIGAGGASLGVNVVESIDGQGVVVARIRPGTPADEMGLRPRDRILSLNGQPVGSVDGFISAIRGMAAGDEVQLSIDRGGNNRDIGGRLEAFRESIAAGQGPIGGIVGRAREFVRDRGERVDINTPDADVNIQTSFEERPNARGGSHDLDARITRLEQQIERLTQDVQQLRHGQGASPTNTSSGTSSLSTPDATAPLPTR